MEGIDIGREMNVEKLLKEDYKGFWVPTKSVGHLLNEIFGFLK
jgi:hypothetical protein